MHWRVGERPAKSVVHQNSSQWDIRKMAKYSHRLGYSSSVHFPMQLLCFLSVTSRQNLLLVLSMPRKKKKSLPAFSGSWHFLPHFPLWHSPCSFTVSLCVFLTKNVLWGHFIAVKHFFNVRKISNYFTFCVRLYSYRLEMFCRLKRNVLQMTSVPRF